MLHLSLRGQPVGTTCSSAFCFCPKQHALPRSSGVSYANFAILRSSLCHAGAEGEGRSRHQVADAGNPAGQRGHPRPQQPVQPRQKVQSRRSFRRAHALQDPSRLPHCLCDLNHTLPERLCLKHSTHGRSRKTADLCQQIPQLWLVSVLEDKLEPQ